MSNDLSCCLPSICFRMSRFTPRTLNPNTSNLVIGTSRTKYIQSRQVGAAIHSYRGATLSELCNLVEQYPRQKLNRVIVIAGFNDHRHIAADFIENWKYLIQLICLKFNPSLLVIPKTIATSNNRYINKKLYYLNFALFELFSSLPLKIISPNFNNIFDERIFARDGVHFSVLGNSVFTRILHFFMNLLPW